MKLARIGIALTAAAILAVCGGSPSSPLSPTGGGTLAIMLKDTPFSDARAVLVTFSEVSAQRSDGTFVSVPLAGGSATRTCDLNKLAGALDLLGTGALEPGHYTQIRVAVSSTTLNFSNPSSGAACAATITPPAGVSVAIDVSPGMVTADGEFDVTDNQTRTITLDFDADQSILRTEAGIYRMRPIIRIVNVQ
jgi:hypothetical protein